MFNIEAEPKYRDENYSITSRLFNIKFYIAK